MGAFLKFFKRILPCQQLLFRLKFLFPYLQPLPDLRNQIVKMISEKPHTVILNFFHHDPLPVFQGIDVYPELF